MNHYANRDDLKSALSLPATATGSHALLDAALEGVSREIDRYVEHQFYCSSGTRYVKPHNEERLDLKYPLLNIDSVLLDTDGDATYETTLTSSDYYTTPDNASADSPPAPWWGLELREDATAVFPKGVQRGAKVTGTWGYYNQRTETTAKPSTAITAADTTWDMSGATALHPGQTIRVDSEQVFIVSAALSGSASAAASGQIRVQRAVNGSVAATHSSNSTMSIYTYPIVDRACLVQAEMDVRALDAPLGVAAAGDMGAAGQALRNVGGLHPFIRRMLDSFRVPVAV
jgi:hypothetical protein